MEAQNRIHFIAYKFKMYSSQTQMMIRQAKMIGTIVSSSSRRFFHQRCLSTNSAVLSPLFSTNQISTSNINNGKGRNTISGLRTRPLASAVSSVYTDPQKIYPPFAKYTHGTTAGSNSSVVYTSGQLGIQPDGTIPDSVYEQTQVCFQNIHEILTQAVEFHNDCKDYELIKVNAFVTNREYLQEYMKARDVFLKDRPLAASTLMIVSGFARPEFKVEVEAIAALTGKGNGESAKSATASATNNAFQRRSFCNNAYGNNLSSFSYPSVGSSYISKRLMTTTTTSTLAGPVGTATDGRVELEKVQAAVHELKEQTWHIEMYCGWESEKERKMIGLKSRDYYWYSPMLKPILKGKTADVLVVAKSEQDVLDVCKAAYNHDIPIVVRGAGTGNYGQAVPLRGGILLDTSQLTAVEDFDVEKGTITVQAGATLQDVEDEARKHGWELRQHPSTKRRATIGGFVAGGSTGHGGLRYGGLGEDGAVLGLRLISFGDGEDGDDNDQKKQPKILELSGSDVAPAVHAYGTTGIITSVTIPLAKAQPWTDVTVVFPTLKDAAECSLEVANAPAIVSRAISVFQAPIPTEYLDGSKLLHDADNADSNGHTCLIQCGASSLGPIERIVDSFSGKITRTIDSAEAPRPMYEFGWNHCTLHALKKDRSVTYLQAGLPLDKSVQAVQNIQSNFDETELLQHLEVLNFGGQIGFASLPLLWPKGDDLITKNERLNEIIQWHEDNGIAVFNPHTYVLEDGGMKQTNHTQLHFKQKADPKGIFNPGKMRAWEEQAVTEDSHGNQAFTKAYTRNDGTGGTEESSSAATTQHQSRYWNEWTTEDFATRDLSKTVAILPLGATEPHGPHLPTGVDSMQNDYLLDQTLQQLPPSVSAVALPQLQIGTSCEHAGFAGTLDISAETAIAMWTEIGGCVAKTGIRKLVLYNGHGGNQALAEVVARQLRLKHNMVCVLVMNLAQASPEVTTDLFPQNELKFGIHGGDIETSLMMHIHPELVKMDKAQNFESNAEHYHQQSSDDDDSDGDEKRFHYHQPGFGTKMGWLTHDLNPNGVVGNAKNANAEKGKTFADSCVDNFSKLVTELHDIDNVYDIIRNGSSSKAVLFPPQGKS